MLNGDLLYEDFKNRVSILPDATDSFKDDTDLYFKALFNAIVDHIKTAQVSTTVNTVVTGALGPGTGVGTGTGNIT